MDYARRAAGITYVEGFRPNINIAPGDPVCATPLAIYKALAKESKKGNKFKPGDVVNYKKPGGPTLGPYLVASVVSRRRYKLCRSNGDLVEKGRAIDEDLLVPA